ncbi:integrin binding sialoprotein [Rhinolophus ferrumequinum]|uniref:Integrin-binding sialoprotein n=1 Tax=Rhinolophus ferrumequinum TaxID=59479 RepID=A0A7J7ZCP1_RHIFE|nr:integrin binding sialoprotein [Rhinolophus ferrumequinum]
MKIALILLSILGMACAFSMKNFHRRAKLEDSEENGVFKYRPRYYLYKHAYFYPPLKRFPVQSSDSSEENGDGDSSEEEEEEEETSNEEANNEESNENEDEESEAENSTLSATTPGYGEENTPETGTVGLAAIQLPKTGETGKKATKKEESDEEEEEEEEENENEENEAEVDENGQGVNGTSTNSTDVENGNGSSLNLQLYRRRSMEPHPHHWVKPPPLNMRGSMNKQAPMNMTMDMKSMKMRIGNPEGTIIEPMRMNTATIKGVAMIAMMVKITTNSSEVPAWDEFIYSGASCGYNSQSSTQEGAIRHMCIL